MHHVVDPRTGRPVAGTLRTVTALGDTCVGANIATDRGARPGQRGADAGCPTATCTARLVAVDGTVTRLGAWPIGGGGLMPEGPLLWFLNRGSGFALLGVLTLTVLLGVLATWRAGGRSPAGVRGAARCTGRPACWA